MKSYEKPALKRWGSVADLTKTGTTNPGSDVKDGSSASRGR